MSVIKNWNCICFMILAATAVGVHPRKGIKLCKHPTPVFSTEELRYSVSMLWVQKKWVLLPHAVGWVWVSGPCLPSLKAVMRADWCQNGVFLINTPSELCTLVSWTGILWCEHEQGLKFFPQSGALMSITPVQNVLIVHRHRWCHH